MKSKLNIWLASSFLVALLSTIWIYYEITRHVGDIYFNDSLDSEEFHLCDDQHILQYYSIGTHYFGGKRAIKKQLLDLFPVDGFTDSGLLTVRFVVNCQGKTGRYRAKMINPSLKEIDVLDKNLAQIYKAISKLNNWQPGTVQKQFRDSYCQISFRIKNGQIIDIF